MHPDSPLLRCTRAPTIALMNCPTPLEISFHRFTEEIRSSSSSVSQLPETASAIWPVVGYISLEDTERAAIFKATAWGEFPK